MDDSVVTSLDLLSPDEVELENAPDDISEPKVSGNPLPKAITIKLPISPSVLEDAYTLATESNVRIADLGKSFLKDPILVLELIKAANNLVANQRRPAIASIDSAIITLGSAQLVNNLESLRPRATSSLDDIEKMMNTLRIRAVKVSRVARIIAGITNPYLTESATISGLMSSLGDMLACQMLGRVYVDLSKELNRASLVYRLINTRNFDVNKIRVAYMRNYDLPESLVHPMDKSEPCKNHSQAHLRFTIDSALEIVEAYHSGKWDKYAPGRPLPTKSALRLLLLSSVNYEAIYELSDTFLRFEGDLNFSQPS